MRWRKWELEKKIKHHEKQRDWFCYFISSYVWQNDMMTLYSMILLISGGV